MKYAILILQNEKNKIECKIKWHVSDHAEIAKNKAMCKPRQKVMKKLNEKLDEINQSLKILNN